MLLYDIKSFSQYLFDVSSEKLKELRISQQDHLCDFDMYLEWVINQLLFDVFKIRVINHYKNDLFNCVYKVDQLRISHAFAGWLCDTTLTTMHDGQARTLINGRDLFITKRYVYF